MQDHLEWNDDAECWDNPDQSDEINPSHERWQKELAREKLIHRCMMLATIVGAIVFCSTIWYVIITFVAKPGIAWIIGQL